MLVIFVSGGPVSGRTTATAALEEYFTDVAGMSTKIITKPAGGRYDSSNIKLQLYKAVIENSADVVLLDGCAYDTYDRAELLTEIAAADDSLAEPREITCVAVNLHRSDFFSFEHNRDEGHHPYDQRALRALLNRVQQPILREGFACIFQVRRDHYVDPNEFIPVLNKVGFDFPYTPKSASKDDTEEADTE